MMSYAWDCFCPVGCCSMVGGMGEDDKQMEEEMKLKSYEGKIIYCSHCRIRFEFTNNKIIEEDCDAREDDIVGG